MYESIISACEVMDTLGLPRAVADFGSDRFIFANSTFLRVAGIKAETLPSLTLSAIVKLHVGSVAWNTGQLIPISIESYDQGFIIRGHAVGQPQDRVADFKARPTSADFLKIRLIV